MTLPNLSPISFSEDTSFLKKLLAIGLCLTIAGFYMPISNKMSNNIFYGLVLLPFLISLFTKARKEYRLGVLSPFFIFLTLCMGAFAFRDIQEQSIKDIIYLICFWTVTSTLISSKVINQNKLALWLMAISFIFCLNILFIHFVLDGQPLSSRPNLWATWRSGSPIDASMILVCFMAIGIATLPKHLRISIGSIAVILALIIQSYLQTRSGLAGMISSGIYAIFLWLFRGRRFNKTLLGGLVTLIAGIIIINHFGFFDIFISRGDSNRIELYQVALKAYMECNIFTGCGYNFDFNSSLRNGEYVAHPHSVYSSLLVYLGPFSLLSLLALQFKAFLNDIKSPSPWFYGVVASSAFFLIDGSKILNHPNLTWICLIFPLAVIDGISKQKDNATNG